MHFIECRDATDAQRLSAAHALIEALRHVPSAWKDLESASEEVLSFVVDPERLAIFAVEEDTVLGWIGAIRQSEHAWELHPLVVLPRAQRRGLGRELVRRLEARAVAEGVITIWLGADDDFGGTNLFGQNLYPDVLQALANLREAAGHPYRFYEKAGYTVTGVFPDADGEGKHDILMAKRLGRDVTNTESELGAKP